MASIILSNAVAATGVSGIVKRVVSSGVGKIGRAIDQKIGWSNSSSPKDGPRLEGFEVQDSKYGVSIPQIFGRTRASGNVIWVSDIIETAHKESIGGGKGAVSSAVFSPSRTTYTYSINCAIAICHGEIAEIETIWADSKIIYQNGVWMDGVIAGHSFHYGNLDQDFDPMLESWIGSGEIPSYKNMAYVVLEGLQLRYFANRLPNLTFEVVSHKDAFEPEWKGSISSDQKVYYPSLVSGALQPIAINGSSSRASKMLIGGYSVEGLNHAFKVNGYDVSEDVPQVLFTYSSDNFIMNDCASLTWELSPDKKYIAFAMQDATAPYKCYFALYHVLNRTFSSVVSFEMDRAEQRQIIWMDSYHIAVTDVSDGKRGLRVFMRAGSALEPLRFVDVWGGGSALNRFPVNATQFIPYGDGHIMLMADRESGYSSFYAIYLAWSLGELLLGMPYEVFSGHQFGAGANAHLYLLPSGDGEYSFVFQNAINMQMMSFVPNKVSAFIKRPWETFYSNVWFINKHNMPVIRGHKLYFLHVANVESQYRMSEFTLDENSFTLTNDALLIEGFSGAGAYYSFCNVDTTKFFVVGGSGAENEISHIAHLKIGETSDDLSFIVETLLQCAGYAQDDFDIRALKGQKIDGYALNKQMTTQAALEPLQLIGAFDLIDQDGVLAAVRLSESSDSYIVPEPDIIGNISKSRIENMQLPSQVSVNYLDATRDYEIGTQSASKQNLKGAKDNLSVNLPVVCSAHDAKQLAEVVLYKSWLEREAYHFALSNACLDLQVGDKLLFDNVELRVLKLSSDGFVHSIDAVVTSASVFQSYAEAQGIESSAREVSSSIATHLYLLDLPLLRSVDDQPGFYIAASGAEGWKGANLVRSSDGVDYAIHATLNGPATSGFVSRFPDYASPFALDQCSEIHVQLISGTLASCTYEELLNGANVALCGSEIIQFQHAQLIGDGLYKLTNLLRGHKGTFDKITNHDLGEAFVLLNEASLEFLSVNLDDRNASYHYRAISEGGSLEYAQDHVMMPQLRTLCPMAPCHLKGQRENGVGSDLALNWMRCARKNTAWVDYIDVPLDEDAELYDIEVLDEGSVVRTFSSIAQPSLTYSAVQQTEDWGVSVPDHFTIKVYQLSARYGRGKPAVGSV